VRAILKKKFGYFDFMGIYLVLLCIQDGLWILAAGVFLVGTFLSAVLDLHYGIERDE
jgi:hypothetical protein